VLDGCLISFYLFNLVSKYERKRMQIFMESVRYCRPIFNAFVSPVSDFKEISLARVELMLADGRTWGSWSVRSFPDFPCETAELLKYYCRLLTEVTRSRLDWHVDAGNSVVRTRWWLVFDDCCVVICLSMSMYWRSVLSVNLGRDVMVL
jgi:hypothetical protein